jgi:hypothetical protein
MIAVLNAKIAECEEDIKATEKWEHVRTVRRDEVGRCRLTVSKPVLKAPMVSALEAIIS